MQGSITIVMGFPASGKSTVVTKWVESGCYRLNRDTTGGSLEGQVELLRKAWGEGHRQIVLDNTYLTKESRASLIAAAKELGAHLTCVWVKTSIEDCQLNACLRMMTFYNKILSPEEIKKVKNPNIFPISVLFGANKKFEAPTLEEGFDKILEPPFVRKFPDTHVNKALILDYDGTLRTSRGPQNWPEKPEHVQIMRNRTKVLRQYEQDGYLLLGASNQSAIAKGLPEADCIACFEKTNHDLGVKIHYQYCPHKIPPFSCYCRKPAPGMGAFFISRYKLLPSQCIMVGDATSDKTFAHRSGFQYQTPEEFFGT